MVHLFLIFNNNMITIFTPTYNRAYLLSELYKSLCAQISKKFEWLVVDDGSTDETEALIHSFISENRIAIRYIKQINGGKHRAINRGVKEAIGEIFFIVDSDDQLVENAVSKVWFYYNQIKYDSSFAGICGIKAFFCGNKVGGETDFGILDCNSIDFRYKYKVRGDMAEIFRTNILKEYPFPEINNEWFCPEAVVWNRIALNYKLRYFNEIIYLCEYLQDGLTAKIVKMRMNSPEASKICYSELYKSPIPFLQKQKMAINYWRFSFCSKASFISKIRQIGIFALVMYPFGLLFHMKDLQS